MRNTDYLERAKEVKPIREESGTKIVSWDDYMDLAQTDLTKGYELGSRTMNPDGSFARTRAKYAAENIDNLYLNRYRVKNGKLWVVTAYPADTDSWRAIREQQTGRIFTTRVIAYVFVRPKDGDLLIDRKATVSAEEFIAEFNESLTNEVMMQIAPLIDSYKEESVATNSIPI